MKASKFPLVGEVIKWFDQQRQDSSSIFWLVEPWRIAFREFILSQEYTDAQIFNGDETGCQYRAMPKSSLVQKKLKEGTGRCSGGCETSQGHQSRHCTDHC